MQFFLCVCDCMRAINVVFICSSSLLLSFGALEGRVLLRDRGISWVFSLIFLYVTYDVSPMRCFAFVFLLYLAKIYTNRLLFKPRLSLII